MSITAETAKEHAKDPAVLCCRAEAGITIGVENLEDPTIFDDLVDSGLLNPVSYTHLHGRSKRDCGRNAEGARDHHDRRASRCTEYESQECEADHGIYGQHKSDKTKRNRK